MANTFKSGKAAASFSSDLQSFYTDFLDKVAPNARKIIDSTLEDIEKEAKKNWPKREKKSQNSFRMFQRGYRVDSSGAIVGFLKNTAPYAWAIKFGIDSQNSRGEAIIFPTGKRVSNELMVKPLIRVSKKVVQALANDIIDQAGK